MLAAHTDAKMRLFDAADESEVRVTLFRDTAAWCPYCQKVWLMLEEKRIPYKISKINMRSYGDKPGASNGLDPPSSATARMLRARRGLP